MTNYKMTNFKVGDVVVYKNELDRVGTIVSIKNEMGITYQQCEIIWKGSNKVVEHNGDFLLLQKSLPISPQEIIEKLENRIEDLEKQNKEFEKRISRLEMDING